MPKRIPSVIVALLALSAAARRLDAQKPERQQEVKIPGIDVSLKAHWQLLFYEGCRFAVPLSWHAEGDGSVARAPDGSNISIGIFKIASWSAHTAQIKAVFGRVRVMHEDSERRLWFEIGDDTHVQHYVDVPNGLNVCSGLLEMRGARIGDLDDTTRRIAEGIGPAPEKWPPGPVK